MTRIVKLHAFTRLFLSSGGGVRLIKDVRDGRGVKGKADKCGKGGEGVQNPGNFADVLYVWSLMGKKQKVNARSRPGELFSSLQRSYLIPKADFCLHFLPAAHFFI